MPTGAGLVWVGTDIRCIAVAAWPQTAHLCNWMTIRSNIEGQIEFSLENLSTGSPGITRACGTGLAEAACVCLDHQGHTSPTSMKIRGQVMAEAAVTWQIPTDQARRCWADLEVATEHGACGVASLLLREISDLQVVERSKKGTGFDYWLGDKDDPAALFQGKARLEVSGIRNGSDSVVATRVRQKLRQTERSEGTLPAVVIVVEFSRPQCRVVEKCRE